MWISGPPDRLSTLNSYLLLLLPLCASQIQDPSIVGTWTSRSQTVFTGPGFYNPLSDRFIEPTLPGSSYSFTADGHFEEALYQAIADPANPQCASSLLQFQHGTYQIVPPNDPSLPPLAAEQVPFTGPAIILNPIAVDGRQLESRPCGAGGKALYLRYNQTEYLRGYAVGLDPYHKVQRLNLFGFDGTPLNPMYLAFTPPQMLPTQTMNPTSRATSGAGAQQTTASKIKRRGLDGDVILEDLLQTHGYKRDDGQSMLHKLQHTCGKMLNKNALLEPDHWWWAGVGMTALGALGYLCF